MLELQLLGSHFHLSAHLLDDPLLLAFQEEHHLPNRLQVLLVVGYANAGRGASVDVVGQASPRVLAGDRPVAASEGEQPIEGVQGLSHRLRIGEGAEVARAIPEDPAGEVHTGPLLLHGDLDEGVAFVVPQPHVIARALLLDQVAFQDQRFDRRGGDGYVQIHRLLHHTPGLGRQQIWTLHVGADPVPKGLGLAHVYCPAGRIAEAVHARFVRQGLDLVFQFSSCHR